MKKTEITLNIPCGYTVKEKTKTLPLYKAFDYLHSKRQHRFTKAVQTDNEAKIYFHVLRCPHCGKETPAYPHYLHRKKQASPKKTKEHISEWARLQLTLFDNPDSTIAFQQPEFYNSEYTCSKCGNSSLLSDKSISVTIGCDGVSVYITREIDDINEILSSKWLSAVSFTLDATLSERIAFNFEKRSTFIELLSADEVIESYDITEVYSEDFGILSTLINKNNIVKRTLKKYFLQFRTSPVPFSTGEISLLKLNNLTRFVDFPRDFYDAIPFTQNDGIDKSFADIVKNLHNPKTALKMLEHSTLPSAKSVKRLFTEKAGLFFYIEECAVLYKILGDINLLCSVLKSEGVYQIVSTLHTFSGIREFYSDYCRVRSEKSLCSLLISNTLALNNQAVRYCALSPACKEAEQTKWKKDRHFFDHCNPYAFCPDSDFSTPMCQVPEHIRNCIIDRFQFKWLITKKEYLDAGRQLHNCLVSWSSYDNPVVAVCKGLKIIAAIEVDGNHIVQARRIRNTEIDKNSALYSSIKKWCNKFSLNAQAIE